MIFDFHSLIYLVLFLLFGIYLYDLVTRSWTKGSSATFANQIKTNFITDWNGDLVHAHTNGTVVKWDDSSSTSAAVDIRTKDIDFQNPGQVKRIYKFYITLIL